MPSVAKFGLASHRTYSGPEDPAASLAPSLGHQPTCALEIGGKTIAHPVPFGAILRAKIEGGGRSRPHFWNLGVPLRGNHKWFSRRDGVCALLLEFEP